MAKNGNIHPTRIFQTPDDLKTAYVYAHIRDNHTPFYIGIGKTKRYKRAFTTNGRNDIWKKIFKKSIVDSIILYNNLTWGEACEIEKTLITYFGRKDKNEGSLANLTDGGEGNLGAIFTKERRINISNSLKGKKLSKERVEACKNRRHSKETIEKIRQAKLGTKASKETKDKMRISNRKGIEASVKKISKIIIDIENGVFYDSVREASEIVGCTRSHLSGMLLGRYNNKTNLRYA